MFTSDHRDSRTVVISEVLGRRVTIIDGNDKETRTVEGHDLAQFRGFKMNGGKTVSFSTRKIFAKRNGE